MADLEAARSELAALEDLLEQLPDIFETKFRRRLRTLLDQTRLLTEQNRRLREQLCTPAGPEHGWFRFLSGLPQREPRRAAQSRLGSPHT